MKTNNLFTVEKDSNEINGATALTELDNAIAPFQMSLLTIATLISDFSLDGFSKDCTESFTLRNGISALIKICVEREKEVFEQFRLAFEKTEYYQFEFAKFRFNLILDGVYEGDMETYCAGVNKVICLLEKIIEKKGDFLSSAMKLKEKCLQELEKSQLLS